MIIDPDAYWRPHTPTITGHIDPLGEPVNACIDRASTASRRLAARVEEVRRRGRHVQLAPGMLVVWDRAPWRVVSIEERPNDWPERFEAAWDEHQAAWLSALVADREAGPEPERATWPGRPVVLVVADPANPEREPLHLCAPARHRWDVLPEHYAACAACGELAPCRHEKANEVADRAGAEAAIRMTFPADACMGCGEAIAGRQKAVAFPGPNLWRPDLPGQARFHARQDCEGWVEQYRAAWRAAGGDQVQRAQLALGDGDAS